MTLLRFLRDRDKKNALTEARAFVNFDEVRVKRRLVALRVTAVSTTTTTAAACTTRTAAGAIFARAGFIDGESAIHEIAAVEKADGLLGFFSGGHRDEAKSAGFAGEFILHQSSLRDGASLGEMILKIVFGGFEGKIPDVKFSGHILLFLATAELSAAVPNFWVSKLPLKSANESALRNN